MGKRSAGADEVQALSVAEPELLAGDLAETSDEEAGDDAPQPAYRAAAGVLLAGPCAALPHCCPGGAEPLEQWLDGSGGA